MSKTYRRAADEPLPAWSKWSDSSKRSRRREETFRCRHCRHMVFPLPSGGCHRNHCPHCLYSRHVDGDRPGDRASHCGGQMAPIGVFARPNGEQVVVQRCLACDFVRFNRVAADDNLYAIMRLPVIAPRMVSAAKEAPGESAGKGLGTAR